MNRILSSVVSSLVAALALSFTACGMGPEAFSGTWTESGTFTTTYNGQSDTDQLSGSVQVLEGAAGGIIFPMGSNCSVPFDVEGDSATLRSGAACNIPISGGGNINLIFSTGNVMLASSLKMMTVSLSGTEIFTVPDGSSGSATFALSSTLNKLAK